jgi:hypothetical protein
MFRYWDYAVQDGTLYVLRAMMPHGWLLKLHGSCGRVLRTILWAIVLDVGGRLAGYPASSCCSHVSKQ